MQKLRQMPLADISPGVPMKRCIVALIVAAGGLLSAPTTSHAGLIPWTYDAIFGYGPAWRGGYYSAGYAPYYGYGAGYAPYGYSAPYYGGVVAPACPGGNCGVVANYAPDIYGCCAPVNPCCNVCPGPCDGCSGPNCTGCNVATTPSEPQMNSVPEKTPTEAPSTYAPRTSTPPDDFSEAERRLREGNTNRGSVPPAGANSGSTPFETPADAEPSDTRGGEDLGGSPVVEPLDLDAKVAYRTPARFRRVHAEAKFRLPTVVRIVPNARPSAQPAPVVASK
jgi:hypothetical protein